MGYAFEVGDRVELINGVHVTIKGRERGPWSGAAMYVVRQTRHSITQRVYEDDIERKAS